MKYVSKGHEGMVLGVVGGRLALPSENDGDDLTHDIGIDDTFDLSGEFCFPLRVDENVHFLLWCHLSLGCPRARSCESPQQGFFSFEARTFVLKLAPKPVIGGASVQCVSNQYRGMGRKDKVSVTRKQKESGQNVEMRGPSSRGKVF